MLKTVKHLIDRTNRLAYIGGAIAVGLMMVQVTAHALAQFVFSYPLPGTVFFISNYYMVVVTFLCIGAVQLRGGHISVDLFTNLLPVQTKRVLTGLSYLITLVVFFLLAWQGFLVAESRRVAGTFELEYDIKFLIWPSYYLVPIGAALMVVTVLYQFIQLVLGTREDDEGNDAPIG
jgi:TRAP-type C4-dicarboxylate transport system permease small subunit